MIQIYRIFSFVRPVLSKSVPTRQNASYPPPSPNQKFLSLIHRKLPHISFKVVTFQPQKQTFWRDRLLVFGLNQRLKHFRFLSSRRSIHLLPGNNFRIMITEWLVKNGVDWEKQVTYVRVSCGASNTKCRNLPPTLLFTWPKCDLVFATFWEH